MCSAVFVPTPALQSDTFSKVYATIAGQLDIDVKRIRLVADGTTVKEQGTITKDLDMDELEKDAEGVFQVPLDCLIQAPA